MRDYQFGEFIYKLRSEHELSQSKLGELVGVSNKAVSKWENGVSKPSMDTLKRLAETFHVSVEELLAGRRFSENKPPETEENSIPDMAESNGAPGVNDRETRIPSSCRQKKIIKLTAIILAALLFLAAVLVSVHYMKPLLHGQEEPLPNTEDPTDLETVKKSVVRVETNLGTGSGFCAIQNNWIITNHHVIENAHKIYITDDDENKTEINSIVFYDEEKDIAILQVAPSFTPIELGDGNAITLQDHVTVIGSPQGVLNTISVGIVSNTSFEDYIVISAPISPGSSGGVLLNDKFQAIGIVTATANDEFAQNLNFAIHIEKLKEAVADHEAGKYPTPDYPLAPPSPPPSSGDDSSPAGEVPQYLIARKPEYMALEGIYRLELGIGSNYGQTIAADVVIRIVMTNTLGDVVYDEKKSVKQSDFQLPDGVGSGLYTAIVDVPISAITPGGTATGTYEITLLYQDAELDSEKWNLERGLPVRYEPFETLYYSGDGVDTVAGVDLPYGTYNIIFLHSEPKAFEVELNGRSIYRNIGGSASYYVYQLKPDEDMYYEGTPLKDAVFNIVCASGPWTMIIERANTSDEGRTYVDGQTYYGSGIGYVKDVYLPYGTYYITIRHWGESTFDIQLDGRSILRQFGTVSYVYTLKPRETLYSTGTPIPSACFNVTEADGDWSITIHRVY